MMQFLNPLLLFGLAAVMIPLLVHLFNFRRYRKIYFSNVQFLKDLKQQTRKQSNLLHRLVLACRILAFIFITLAFAQPFLSKLKDSVTTKSNIVSVYIDNSFSMEAQGSRGSLIEEAKSKALEIANAYKQDDLFQILTNDFEGKHQQFLSKDEFTAMVNDIQPSSQIRSLREISVRQSDALSAGRTGNILVHYLSDFQKSTVLKALPDTSLGKGYLIPLKPVLSSNIFIDSCWFVNPVLQLNEQSTLMVRLQNVSDISLEKIPVRLFIENAQRAVATVDIDAGASQDISFSFSNNKSGYIGGHIEINDFPVTYDDIYYFTYKISSEIPVLCINNLVANPFINSVYSIDSIIKLNNTSIKQVDFSSLHAYRLIVLNELPTYSSGLVQEVTAYIENGGNILIIPSLESNITELNNLLTHLGSDQISSLDNSSVKVSHINTNHPIYKEVFETGSLKEENLDMPVVNAHYTTQSSSSSQTEALLNLANGQPLLSFNKKGKGKVYLLSASLEEKASNFGRHALFVPTMLNIAFQSEELRPLMYHTNYQDPIVIAGNYSHGDNIIKLVKQTGNIEFIPQIRQNNGETQIYINNQIAEAGLYHVMHDNELIGLLAFNFNRNESELKLATDEEINTITDKTGYELITNSPKPLDTIINNDLKDKNLWKWFVIAALLALIAETLLLAFYSRRSPV